MQTILQIFHHSNTEFKAHLKFSLECKVFDWNESDDANWTSYWVSKFWSVNMQNLALFRKQPIALRSIWRCWKMMQWWSWIVPHLIEQNRSVECIQLNFPIKENMKTVSYQYYATVSRGNNLTVHLQRLQRKCEADLKFALFILENPETTPLPPAVISRMKQHQYHNSTKLHKMLNFVEVSL